MTVKEFKQEMFEFILQFLEKEGISRDFFEEEPYVNLQGKDCFFGVKIKQKFNYLVDEPLNSEVAQHIYNFGIDITAKNDDIKLSDLVTKDEKAFIEEHKNILKNLRIAKYSILYELRQEYFWLPHNQLRLLTIKIENYQAIKEASIENLPADTKWIFLTGENGFGKTSVLRAIALGLYDFGAIYKDEKLYSTR